MEKGHNRKMCFSLPGSEMIYFLAFLITQRCGVASCNHRQLGLPVFATHPCETRELPAWLRWGRYSSTCIWLLRCTSFLLGLSTERHRPCNEKPLAAGHLLMMPLFLCTTCLSFCSFSPFATHSTVLCVQLFFPAPSSSLSDRFHPY